MPYLELVTDSSVSLWLGSLFPNDAEPFAVRTLVFCASTRERGMGGIESSFMRVFPTHEYWTIIVPGYQPPMRTRLWRSEGNQAAVLGVRAFDDRSLEAFGLEAVPGAPHLWC